jgi:putative aldouronate transport system substrate-binding protein
MYEDGWIDREFAVKGNSGIFEDMAANKFGLMFQGSAGPARFRDLKKNQPQSDWKPVLIPAVDGGVASSETNVAPGGFWVVRKGYPFPGVAWKLANFRMEKLAGETAELKYHTIGEIQTSLLGVRMIINHPDNTGHDSTYKKIVVDRLDEGITSEEGLIPQNKLYLESILAVESGDYNVQQWFLTRVFGRGGSGQLMYEAKEAGLDVFEIDQFYGVPGDAMARNWATLTTMRDEVFTKIIMGESELDAFDDFVRDWYRLGGREVTQEVNDWADARQ